MRRTLGLFALVSATAFGAGPTRVAGTAYFGTERYVEYIPGELPVVLTSPHGGRLQPESLPDRTEGVTNADANSQELTRAMSDALFAAAGKRPYLIASHLHRKKLDPNREIKEAAAGNVAAERAWVEFHAFIREAIASAVARHGFAFLIDVHGHAHAVARLELGYGLGGPQLNQGDRAFNASDLIALSTLRNLHARAGGSGAELIRGPRSLGALFTERGIRSVPSPAEPGPGADAFFSGGYTVRTYSGSATSPKADAVQFEAYRTGIRDTAANRAKFAAIAADVLTIFLRERYRFELAARTGSKK